MELDKFRNGRLIFTYTQPISENAFENYQKRLQDFNWFVSHALVGLAAVLSFIFFLIFLNEGNGSLIWKITAITSYIGMAFYFYIIPAKRCFGGRKKIADETKDFLYTIEFYEDYLIEYRPACVRKVDYSEIKWISKKESFPWLIRYGVRNDLKSFRREGMSQGYYCFLQEKYIPETLQSELYDMINRKCNRRRSNGI